MRLVLILSALAVTFGLTVWSAMPPGSGPARVVLAPAEAALSHVADWYRAGPADGRPDWEAAALDLYDANAARGADHMVLHGCGACHVVPGISGAIGTVGPSLEGFADRAYVAGILPNQPGPLTRWLVDPPLHAPQTAMPDMGISEQEARDMAAYLYLLRGS